VGSVKKQYPYTSPTKLAQQFRPAARPVFEADPVNLPPPRISLHDGHFEIGRTFPRSDRSYPGQIIDNFGGQFRKVTPDRKFREGAR